jgi:aryl-alcohol dehydrogenase-like predicted oxidoreductase
MSKLALGTVQFGQPYGVANTSGQVTPSVVATILDRASKAGIDTLDTAIAYGSSETCLGEAGVSSWRVITKLPTLPDGVANVSEWAETQVLGSLRRLKIAQLDGLLLHRPSDLVGPRGTGLVEALSAFKSRGWVRSLGISIYDPVELDMLWPVWQPEIIQAPCNVFDRRLMLSGWLARLNGQGVRIHIRSVFLQGLLLMSASRRPAWFGQWSSLLDRWVGWCDRNETSPLQAALAFARGLPSVERLVVGVDSVAQLDEILAAAAANVALPPGDLFSEDRDLIDPSCWKLT